MVVEADEGRRGVFAAWWCSRHDVVLARNGGEALALLQSMRVDVVVASAVAGDVAGARALLAQVARLAPRVYRVMVGAGVADAVVERVVAFERARGLLDHALL